MVSIEQLQQAKPRQWEEAADTWDICARAWPSLDRDYQDLVVQRLHHWSGPAAMAAKLLVNSVQQGFRGDDGQDLADWMRKTAEILRGFAAKLAEAKPTWEQRSRRNQAPARTLAPRRCTPYPPPKPPFKRPPKPTVTPPSDSAHSFTARSGPTDTSSLLLRQPT